ncbi:MAG TPA: hypothetical protein PLJ35_05205 [Anaerolineae bacterium]|nr:hypothetical protein [Anaerolineae bacterium]
MNPHVLNECRCFLGICICACLIIGGWIADYRWAKRARPSYGKRRYPR